VPVCADLEPYRGVLVEGETGFLFRDAEGLAALLERLAGDPALRAAVAARASRWARTERLERPRAVDRLETYRTWARELGYPFEPGAHPELGQAGIPSPGGYTPLSGPLPAALYEALLLARRDPSAASRSFAELAARTPGFYLPRLYQARSQADPAAAVRLLEEALALAPASCAAAYLVAERLAEAGRLDEARGAFSRCEEICPELGAAAWRLGELLAAGGSRAAALDCFRRAHAQNPFLAGPALQLAVAALAEGRAPESVALLGELVRRDDRLLPARLLLGRALIESGRPGDAVVHLEFALGRSADPVPALLQLARAQSMLGQVQVARYLLEEAKRHGAKV
jgi:tetratricopeptide (TPR) repeat protein